MVFGSFINFELPIYNAWFYSIFDMKFMSMLKWVYLKSYYQIALF
jgi:hypothetical protein